MEEDLPTRPLRGRRQQIEIARRDAAGRYQRIRVPERLREKPLDRFRLVFDGFARRHDPASRPAESVDHRAVRVPQLPSAGRLAGGDQLVSGGRDRDPRPPPHAHGIGSGKRGECDSDRVEPAGLREQYGAAFDAFSPSPEVSAFARSAVERDPSGLAADFLDRNHGIRAGRERRPRHDAHRLARRERRRGRVAGGDEAGALAESPVFSRLAGGERVAVHRRRVERGPVHVGDDVGSENSSESVG